MAFMENELEREPPKGNAKIAAGAESKTRFKVAARPVIVRGIVAMCNPHEFNTARVGFPIPDHYGCCALK
jgi:hypothetical protein